MKLLLDTHTFIWWDSAPAKLSLTALALCSDPANQLVLSVASLWEIQIKRQLGKLDQAMAEASTLVSVDPILKSYPVEVRW